jgi:hypothetical protein
MSGRSPIYSAQAARRQIGYIEGDKAFDLCGRPCAIYEGDSGLLRSPKHDAVVGYVSLANIFVGPSRMVEELFLQTGPVPPPRESPEGIDDQDFNSPVRSVEDGDAQDVSSVLPVAQKPPLDQTVKTNLPNLTLRQRSTTFYRFERCKIKRQSFIEVSPPLGVVRFAACCGTD